MRALYAPAATSYSLKAPLVIQERNGSIILQPEYQRDFIWKESTCSKFIETVLLGLPFQEVWLHDQPAGHKEVIDGQQRLTTIKVFVDGRLPSGQKFKLEVNQSMLNENRCLHYHACKQDNACQTLVSQSMQDMLINFGPWLSAPILVPGYQ